MSDSNTTRRAAADWIEAIEEACADPAAGPVTGVEDAMAAFEREDGLAAGRYAILARRQPILQRRQ
jgi:hypothetical protein